VRVVVDRFTIDGDFMRVLFTVTNRERVVLDVTLHCVAKEGRQPVAVGDSRGVGLLPREERTEDLLIQLSGARADRVECQATH